MNKISTLAMRDNEIFWELKLTVGLDLGDRASLTASWLRQAPCSQAQESSEQGMKSRATPSQQKGKACVPEYNEGFGSARRTARRPLS